METQAIVFFLQFAAVLGKTSELRTYFVWDKSPRVPCFNPTKLTLYISVKFYVYICFIQWNKCINIKNSHCKKKENKRPKLEKKDRGREEFKQEWTDGNLLNEKCSGVVSKCVPMS